MKIALLGYGRMGKAIEKKALEKGHEVTYKTNEKIDVDKVLEADVAIDFSVPKAAFQNISICLKNNVPVVSGTTGWLDQYDEVVQVCHENKGAFLYASNFSIGVNLFFELNEKFAKMMRSFDEYGVEIEETHHTKKLDAPSGTAISLAQQIIKNTNKTRWKLVEPHAPDKNQFPSTEIPITAKRVVDVPGTHLVKYTSNIDNIELKHTAHSRDGFVLGALMAAEWLQGKNGVYGMKDLLKSILL